MLKRLLSRRRDAESEADQADDAPTQPREAPGFNLAYLSLVAFLVSAALITAVALLAFLQMRSQVEAQHRAVLSAQGAHVAAEMTGRVEGLVAVIESAAAQPALAAAMQSGDAAALAIRAEVLQSAIPGAIAVRFLVPNTTQPDETQTPRLGFAVLDLAHRAEQGERPPLEVHWLGNPDQYVAIVRAIAAPQQPVAGVLVVSMDLKTVERWLQASLPQEGFAELRQTNGEGDLLLASSGDALVRSASPAATSRVPGTAWSLHYWAPSAEAPLLTSMQTSLIALFGGALLGLGIVFALLTWIWLKLMRGDLHTLVEHLIDRLQRRRDRGQTVRLRHFREAVKMLDDAVPSVAAPNEPAEERVRENRVTEDPIFLQHESSIVVEESSASQDEARQK